MIFVTTQQSHELGNNSSREQRTIKIDFWDDTGTNPEMVVSKAWSLWLPEVAGLPTKNLASREHIVEA